MEGVQFIGGNVPSWIAFGNSDMCSPSLVWFHLDYIFSVFSFSFSIIKHFPIYLKETKKIFLNINFYVKFKTETSFFKRLNKF